MLASYSWICELAQIDPQPEELADRLTFCGLEVEDVRAVGQGLDNIVIARVESKTPHPSRDKLHIVQVEAHDGMHQVVCGAPNCPPPGGLVVLALPGATVQGHAIAARKLAGVPSEGMLCSEEELDIGPDGDGIIVLEEGRVGTPVVEALKLRDWIYDIGITPNRPDALSHRGLARDAALLYGQPFDPPTRAPAPEQGPEASSLAKVSILDADRCPRYGAALVNGIEIGPSPFAVRYRLHTLGVRPISNVVDVTNLIMLEYGQPLHAFDLDRLAGPEIVVRRARDKETMSTLDDIERTFTDDDLLICDGARAVAVAGVMGGLDTEIEPTTKNVLLECAYFQPSGVRRTSKRLKLSSESSYRFERGVDPNMVPQVLEAAASLTTALAGGAKAPGVIDCYPQQIKPLSIEFRTGRFEQLMGYTVPPTEMKNILVGIGARVEGSDTTLTVQVPTSRPDIEREVDLIEEIARIRGLNDVPSVLPHLQCIAPDRPQFEMARRAKILLAALGLSEAVSYSFVSKSMLEAFGVDEAVVPLANPLSAERGSMRTTLLAGLAENYKRAQTRFISTFNQFEVANTFHDVGNELPQEVLRAAALVAGPVENWVGQAERSYDFYDVKGLAMGFVREYAGWVPVLEPTDDIPYLHPKRACRILIDGAEVGVMGELHPSILNGLKLPRGAAAMELSLDELQRRYRRSKVVPLSEYPPMARDVALLVGAHQDAGPLNEALLTTCAPLAKEVRLFDVYRGKGIAEDQKSLAFSIIYRSDERTLTDEEVDQLHQRAIAQVAKQFGAVIR